MAPYWKTGFSEIMGNHQSHDINKNINYSRIRTRNMPQRLRIWIYAHIGGILNRKWALSVLLFISWLLIQYFFGKKIIGLLLVVYLFILLISSRKPYFPMLIGSIFIIIIFFTPLLDALRDIRDADLQALEGPRQTLKNIYSPNSGQEVLPRQVQQILTLLHSNTIEDFQLSDEIRNDPLLVQRTTEAAWPIKVDGSSHYFIVFNDEMKPYPDCNVIDQAQDVALVYCR